MSQTNEPRTLMATLRLCMAAALAGAMTLANAADSITVKRGALTVEFPSQPATSEATDQTKLGEIERFAAVAVTKGCDYALFEHKFSLQIVEALGETALLGQAVQEAVMTHGAQVEQLERTKQGGLDMIDVHFLIDAQKSTGRSRFFRIAHAVYEVSALCSKGEKPDADFFGLDDAKS
ncbi:MAG: hypothetical protein HOI95_05365 [Chromatiales bacterium]|nr:hypothetical protein [Chromatiales bacterium]